MAVKDQVTEPLARLLRAKGLLGSGAFDLARGAVVSMRPVQWTKSIVVFLPLAFSMNERWSTDDLGVLGELFLKSLAGAAIFCALSGGIYIINDIFDRHKDRSHPQKRKRPIAAGALNVGSAVAIAVVILELSVGAGFLMGVGFGLVCVVFLAINLGYSSFVKELIILDVMVVSTGYLLRIVAGALIIDVTVSPWLYTTTGLGALFIALGKRYSELRASDGNAASQRTVLDEYTQPLLNQLITITGTASLVAYALYTFTAGNVPDNHTMMLTVPFVVFGLFRYLYLVNQTYEAESPELVIIRDKPLVIDILVWAATVITVLLLNQ